MTLGEFLRSLEMLRDHGVPLDSQVTSGRRGSGEKVPILGVVSFGEKPHDVWVYTGSEG